MGRRERVRFVMHNPPGCLLHPAAQASEPVKATQSITQGFGDLGHARGLALLYTLIEVAVVGREDMRGCNETCRERVFSTGVVGSG